MVISHGGTGSVLHCMARQKPFIACANPKADGDHQAEFLERLSRVQPIIWTRSIDDIEDLLLKVEPSSYLPSESNALAEALLALIAENSKSY